MLSFCITLHPHTHMRRLHRLALSVVWQARSLSAALRAGSAALRAGNGAEKRVAVGLLAAGRVGWCGSWQGRVVEWRAGWGGGGQGAGWRWRAGWGLGGAG